MAKLTIYYSFEEAEKTWKDLQQRCSLTVFQTYEWLKNWYDTAGKAENYLPVLVEAVGENNGRDATVFFLPMGIKKQRGMNTLTWLGGMVSDYHGPILGPGPGQFQTGDIPALLNEIIKALRYRVDRIILNKQPETIDGVRNPFVFEGCGEEPENASHLKPGTAWPEYFKNSIKGSVRSDTLRQLKRLNEKGNLVFLIAQNDRDADRITEAMIRQKEQKYAEIGAYNLFQHDYYRRLYMGLPKLAGDGGGMKTHLSALVLNDEIIAVHWGLTFRKRFYYLMPSYQGGEIATFSPGKVHLYKLLEWAFENQYEVFDFTIGGESYKKSWCNGDLKLYQYRKTISWKGAVLTGMENALARMKNRKMK